MIIRKKNVGITSATRHAGSEYQPGECAPYPFEANPPLTSNPALPLAIKYRTAAPGEPRSPERQRRPTSPKRENASPPPVRPKLRGWGGTPICTQWRRPLLKRWVQRQWPPLGSLSPVAEKIRPVGRSRTRRKPAKSCRKLCYRTLG